MLKPSEQAVFRPLVDRAWLAQCRVTGARPNDKIARQAWYREVLRSVIRVESTKDADSRALPVLVTTFTRLAQSSPDPQPALLIEEWTDAQNAVLRRLAAAAWEKEQGRGNSTRKTFEAWFESLAASCGLFHGHAPDKTHSFDRLIEALAIRAGDERWMRRTSEGDETRLRYLIGRLLERLSALEGMPVTWSYVRGIYDQAALLPADIADAPGSTLFKVFQMLDTHRRRLQKRRRTAIAEALPF